MIQELKRQLNDINIETRRQAVEFIRGKKDPEYVPLLMKAMQDVSWRVRKSAVNILFEDYSIEQYIDDLIQLLYLDDNAGARNSAIEILTRLGKKVTLYLIKAFRTPNKDVRKFIIDILGDMKDTRSLALMLEAVKDEDDNVRATAVEHLGKIGESSVVDALIGILESGDLWTAYPAADALGRIGDRKAVPSLVKALENKPLREPVLKALGLIADPSSLEYIITCLNTGTKNIQEQALKTLEIFYRKGTSAEVITGELKRIIGDKVIDLLIRFAWSNRHEVRVAAILLLGLMKDEEAYGPLLDISHEEEYADNVKKAFVFIGKDRPDTLLKLFNTDNIHQLRFMCEIAGQIASPVYYDVLDEMLKNSDGHVRALAARSISRLKDKRAIPKLMLLLRDEYEDVQEAAIDALSELKDDIDVSVLLTDIHSTNTALRRNIVMLLGKIKAFEAVKELGFALKDSDINVRKAAVWALSQLGNKEAVRYLTYALTDENSDIRISAILSLGNTGGEEVLEAIDILALDPDSSVRVAAARAMGMLRNRRAIHALVNLLNDKNGFVISTAIESLRAIGSDEARDAIINVLASADEEIKRTAIASLEGFEGVEDKLLQFLKDPDWATRLAAVRALGRSKIPGVRIELEKLLDTEEDQSVIKALEEILHV